MALDAGVMSLTVEYAKDLKDRDWFGKQDPYVVVRVGTQTFRSRTCVDGGRAPVWNETFRFNLINENSAEIKIYDEDTLSRDDVIGEVMVPLAKAREQGGDALQLPVVSAKSRKQRGFLAVRLQWAPNSALRPQHAQQPMAAPYPPPMPMGMPMGYPPAAYPYPYATPPPSAYYAPMPGYAQYPPPAMHYPPMPMPLPAQARQ